MESVSGHSVSFSDETPIDLRKYWAVLLKRKAIVLLVFVVVVGATAIYTLRQPKIYSASTSLIIDSQLPQVLSDVREAVEVGNGSYWYNKEFYETQYNVIKSRAVAQRVVEQLGLANDLDFLGVSKLSSERQAEVLARVDAAAVLQGRVAVEPVRDSRIAKIVVEDGNPERAAVLADAVAQAYIQANLDRRIDGSKDAASWLEQQLGDLKVRLTESELSLHSFKEKSDLVYTTLENKQTIASQKLIAINDALTRVKTRKAELGARVGTIEAAKKTGEQAKVMELGIISSNVFINGLKLEAAKIESEAADLAERYGPEHPKMRAVRERLSLARQRLTAEIDSVLAASLAEYEELAQTERNLVQMLEEVKRESFENNKKEMDYKRLAREEETNQQLYDMVLKRMKELELSSLLTTNNVRILDAAQVNNVPVKPRVRSNLILAIVLGLAGGIALAFVVEYQDRSIKSHQDVEGMGLNFLGVVPTILAGASEQPGARDMYTAEQPRSTAAECCRTIRTNMSFMSPGEQIKRMVVTSSSPQEGKTTTLVGLGIALASGGNRVLLVDSDMRRPRLHKTFSVSNECGLSNLIVGECAPDLAIKKTSVAGLFVLPSGPIPPNPAELLQSQQFRELARSLGERFDRVLFDSPPVGAVSDALVLANALEGTLLVLRVFKTDRDVATRSVRALRDAGAGLLGAVLNDVDLERERYGYYSGYYYGDGAQG